MTWLTWRQHRLELCGAAAVAALGLGVLLLLHAQVSPASKEPTSSIGIGVFLGLLALPPVAGMFLGAPLIGRELEQGTIRMAVGNVRK